MLLSYMSRQSQSLHRPTIQPNHRPSYENELSHVSPFKSALTELLIPKDLISFIIRTYRKTGVGSQPSQPVLFSPIHLVAALARPWSTLPVPAFRCDNACVPSMRTTEHM